MLVVKLHLALCDARRLAEADTQGCRDGSGSEAALLPSTVDDGLEADARTTADVRRANALGAVQLVPADAHDVDLARINIDGDLANSLRSVRVEEGVLVLALDERANLFKRLDGANLIVDGHDGHEACVWADGSLELGEIDLAILLHRQIRDVESFVLEDPAAIEDTLVLRL